MTLEVAIKTVEKEIQNFNSGLSSQELYTPIKYIMSLGGKRLRPALAILSNAYFGGDLENICRPAIGIEVFHNFSLMHDDIMDNAPIRRGKQTVHEKWNANSAILSGDAMLVQAYQLLAETKGEFISPLLNLFSKTALEVCEGQQFDMDFEQRDDVSIKEYLEMITLKTSVLLACALETGAITAGASEENRKNIYAFGLNMGIAFQLRDDYLDAFGEVEKVGKQTGGDILANKKTFLALKALEKSSQDQRKVLLRLAKETNPEKKIQNTLQVFRDLKVDEETEALSQAYFEKAIHALNQTAGSPNIKQQFLEFSEGLMVREY